MENAKVYSVGKFAKLIGKSVRTVQRWDKDGLLVAKRSVTGRRFYTHAQYQETMGIFPAPGKKKIVS